MVTIFGAGIAGLTTAFELVKKGFKVKIYEKDTVSGGMAKSKRVDGIPSEHSWRGYARFYNNIFDILKQIPNTDNEYTMDQFNKKVKNGSKWIIYKNEIYDIETFINVHPGGNIISKAVGKDVEKVWENNSVLWHIKAVNFRKIKEIKKIGNLMNPDRTNSGTALDNLVNPFHLKIYNDKFTEKKSTDLLLDSPGLLYHFLTFSLSNLRSQKYYSLPLLDYVENVSKYTYDSIIGLLGPGLGLDKQSCSLGLIFHYLNLDLATQDLGYNPTWSVLNKPTSEGFIDPLVELLKSKGVEFIYNSELKRVYHKYGKVTDCLVIVNGKEQFIQSEEVVIAINPNNCYNIFNLSDMPKLAKQHQELSITNNQISFRLGIKNRINFDEDHNGLVMVDSPYNITFYGQEHFFNVPIDTKNRIQSLWSGTCVQTYNKGIKYNKTAINLKKEELIEEIIEQILISEELQNEILKVNGKKVTRDDIIYWEIWDDWFWNGQYLESKNKKWVNTINNEKFKPDQKTEYDNLYLAGGHTKTSLKIWSMEAACESGKTVANHILNKNGKENCLVVYHDKPSYFKVFEKYDDMLYNNNLPSLIDVIFAIIVIYIIIKLKNIRQ